MERSQLKYVIEIAKYENITHAAEALHITQPSLSNQLINLENELGISLFERSRKRVYLTEAGKHFVHHAKRILNEFEDLSHLMQDFATEEKGSIRIGVLPQMASLDINNLIASFQSLNPNIQVFLREGYSSELCSRIKESELDICFAISSTQESANNLEQIEILQVQPVAAVSKQNPLSKKKRLSLEDFRNQRIILISPDAVIHHNYLNILDENQIPYNIVGICNQILSCFALVEVDFGIALCSETTSQYHNSPQIAYLPIDGFQRNKINLVFKKNPLYYPVLRSFIEYALSYYKKDVNEIL